MKSLGIVLGFLANPLRRRNLMILVRLLFAFALIVLAFSGMFHTLMLYEGREYSWATGMYWVLTVMSTLGFGDITFHSDLGRIFTIIVLLTGTIFMLVIMPFMFIQFFYVHWMEAQAAARAPRELPATTRGHVILTGMGAIEYTLIRGLIRMNFDYVVIVSDLNEALRLHDEGFKVILGEIDDPETYVNAQVKQAAMVVALQKDTTNTNIVFTVREISESVIIVSSASSAPAVEVLQLAGCNEVIQLAEMLGQSFARHAMGRDARCRVIGHFGKLLIAEAMISGTPLVGRTLRETHLSEHARVTVVGIWERGKFELANADTKLTEKSILVMAGTKEQLDEYDSLFCIYEVQETPVVIIGAGRVGRATAKHLAKQSVDFRVIDRLSERIKDPQRYILGDASELDILKSAGIMKASSVVITTHDDDMNVYLAIYIRKLRPDIQVLGRANLEKNVSTLHRAGVDFVHSFTSTGANVIINLLRRGKILLLAEGLDLVRIPIPKALVGQTLMQADIRRLTGCNVVALVAGDKHEVNPDPMKPLPAECELIIIGDDEAEEKFFSRWN